MLSFELTHVDACSAQPQVLKPSETPSYDRDPYADDPPPNRDATTPEWHVRSQQHTCMTLAHTWSMLTSTDSDCHGSSQQYCVVAACVLHGMVLRQQLATGWPFKSHLKLHCLQEWYAKYSAKQTAEVEQMLAWCKRCREM
jgi:hypothetical protein